MLAAKCVFSIGVLVLLDIGEELLSGKKDAYGGGGSVGGGGGSGGEGGVGGSSGRGMQLTLLKTDVDDVEARWCVLGLVRWCPGWIGEVRCR